MGKLFGDVGGALESIRHDYADFNWIFSGSDMIVAEGTSYQCQVRDPAEADARPLPLSVTDVATRGFFAVAVASIAFLVAASLVARGLSPRWWLPTLGMLVLPGVAVLRWSSRGRYVAHGWLAGLALSVLLIAWALLKWLLTHTS